MSINSFKQALEVAVQSIEMRDDIPPGTKRDIMRCMHGLYAQVGRRCWTKEEILDAIHKFKDNHGRYPTLADLNMGELPSEYVIKARCNHSLRTLLIQEFPELAFYQPPKKSGNFYDSLTKEEWLTYFSEQFNKHLCPGMNGRVYNQRRDKGTPTWHTIAMRTGDITWRNLMRSAGVHYINEGEIETIHTIVVDEIDSPILNKLSEYISERKRLNDELVKILTNQSIRA